MSKSYVTGPGGYNALCDQCGMKFKASQLRKRWDGHMVCEKDWEPRHPMDFFRTIDDTRVLPWTRPDNDGYDVSPSTGIYCTPYRARAMADFGTADCAKADKDTY
jgi:hypothetical protein